MVWVSAKNTNGWKMGITITDNYVIKQYRHEAELKQGHVNLAGFPNAASWQRNMQVELRHKPSETSPTPSMKRETSPINGKENSARSDFSDLHGVRDLLTHRSHHATAVNARVRLSITEHVLIIVIYGVYMLSRVANIVIVTIAGL